MAIDPNDFEEIAPSKAEIGSKGLPLALAQGMTGNWSDEIQGALAALPIAALKGQSVPDSYREGRDIARKQYSDFQAQNPKTALATELAGGVGGAVLGGNVLANTLPSGLVTKAADFAGRNPLKTLSGIGAVSGAVAGAGRSEGGLPETAQDAAMAGAIGSVAGPAVGAAASFLAPRVGPLAQRAQSILQKSRTAPPMTGPSVTPAAPIVPPSTQGMVARLPTGAKTMDVDMMRAEESARQGLLGPVAQTQINQVDDVFKTDVAGITKSLTGDGESADLMAKAAGKVRSRYEAEKRLASSLMNKRNDALGRASIYKDYTKETLGKDVDELLATPDIKASVAMLGPDNQINNSVNYLKKLTDGPDKAVNFAEVSAWRKSLNNLDPSKPEYQIGKQLSAKYDDWLENINKQALINADDDIVDKIFKANSNYREFKQKYGTDKYRGQAKAIEDIIQKTELSSLELSNTIMGANVKGRGNSAQIVKRMIEIVPEKKRPEMIDDLRRGLVMRAAENAYSKADAKGNMSLGTFRNELRKLKSNEAYNQYLKDPEFDKTIEGLASDITKYLEAQSRKDVYSPSGGAVARAADKILAGLGVMTYPAGGNLVTNAARAAVRKGSEEAGIRPTRKAFQQSIDEFMDGVRQNSIDARKVYGAAASGAVSSQPLDVKVARPPEWGPINQDDFEIIE